MKTINIRKGLGLACVVSSMLLAACIPEIPALQSCPATLGGNIALHTPGASPGDEAWPSWGGDLSNSHYASAEATLSTANVANLEVKWVFNTTGSVSATPTITDNQLFITDWGPGGSNVATWPGGKVFSVDINTGGELWSKRIRQLNNDSWNNVSRSSPAIFEDLVILADVQNPVPMTIQPSLRDRVTRWLFGFNDVCGGYVYALSRSTGDLVWSRRIGTKEFDQISQSPIVYNDKVYVGVSSHESTYTRSASVPCCRFRGSFVALNAHNGNIEWRTWMIEDTDDYDQYSGAAVWAGAPTIDPARNSVYVPTGNNYWIPASAQACLQLAGDDEVAQEACFSTAPRNFFDSIVSLDLDTGNVNWDMNANIHDAWTTACDYEHLFPLLAITSSRANCPNPKGPDSDFAQPPMLASIDIGGGVFEDRLFAGTKAGEFFAIDPDDGSVIWRKQIGPGGLIGGMQFGAATDGQRIYIQNTNFDHTPYTLEAGSYAGTTIRSGFWAALDPVNGDILWQTPVPNYNAPIEGGSSGAGFNASSDSNSTGAGFDVGFSSGDFHPVWGFGLGEGYFNWPMGGLTVANGVVFAGVADLQGTMVAMNASTGTILWQYQTGQSVVSSPSVVDGRVYWGSGYKTGTPGNRVYSFGLP